MDAAAREAVLPTFLPISIALRRIVWASALSFFVELKHSSAKTAEEARKMRVKPIFKIRSVFMMIPLTPRAFIFA